MTTAVPVNVGDLVVSDEQLRQVPRPVVVNVAAGFEMTNPSINSETLSLRMPGFAFNHQLFAAAKIRMYRAMVLRFSGGSSVCPGAQSIDAARLAALRCVEIHLRAGEYCQYRKFRVQNFVLNVVAPFEINLMAIAERYSARIEWSDKFPGLTFRLGKRAEGRSNISFNIFRQGSVVIMGAKSEHEANIAWWWLYTTVLVPNQGSGGGDGTLPPPPLPIPPAPMPASSSIEHRDAIFANHSVQCAFRTAADDATRLREFAAIVAAARDDDGAQQRRRIVESHNRAGCVVGQCATDNDAHAILERLGEQLMQVLGEHRIERVLGPRAWFAGHSIDCAWVSAPARATDAVLFYDAESRTVATAMALGDAEPVLASHRTAGCSLAGADDDDRLRWLHGQLTAAIAWHDDATINATRNVAALDDDAESDRLLAQIRAWID